MNDEQPKQEEEVHTYGEGPIPTYREESRTVKRLRTMREWLAPLHAEAQKKGKGGYPIRVPRV